MDDEKYMTTEVPERLLIEVKVHAARSKRKVRELVAEAVETWLKHLKAVEPMVTVLTALDYGSVFRFRGRSGADYAVSYRTWQGVDVCALAPDPLGGLSSGENVSLAEFLRDAPPEVMRRELTGLLDAMPPDTADERLQLARAALGSAFGATIQGSSNEEIG